jgi:hypothetical protein
MDLRIVCLCGHRWDEHPAQPLIPGSVARPCNVFKCECRRFTPNEEPVDDEEEPGAGDVE